MTAKLSTRLHFHLETKLVLDRIWVFMALGLSVPASWWTSGSYPHSCRPHACPEAIAVPEAMVTLGHVGFPTSASKAESPRARLHGNPSGTEKVQFGLLWNGRMRKGSNER